MSLLLYAIVLLIQTMRHRRYFVEYRETVAAANSAHHPLQTYSTGFHATMLLLYMVTVILLAKKFAIPLDNSIERFGMPQAFGGAIIAALGACARRNRRDRRRRAQSVAAFDKHPVRVRARDYRTHYLRCVDDWTQHETISRTRGARRQSSVAAVDPGSECRHVYQQKDKCFAGLRPLTPFRCICALNFCALNVRSPE